MGVVRTGRALGRLNQVEGFDCMSCAWPDEDPDHRSAAAFCESGAKAVAEEATRERVDRGFFAEHSLKDLASRSDHWLGSRGRLTEPMVRRAGSDHYEPISWSEAFSLVAEHLRALASPDEAIFYTSGRTSNEAAFVYQLFVRAFGTNNLPDCSNMCHESTSVALAETTGIGKGSVTLQDVHEAELIVICGQNPGTNHPRMLTALEKAKKNGAKILAVNPLPEAGLLGFRNPQTPRGVSGIGTTLADVFLPIRVNGDLALFQGIGALLLDAERDAAQSGEPGTVLDLDFIGRSTRGFEEWATHLGDLDWEQVLASTGLTYEQIGEAADMFLASRRTVICWAMGITQHRNAVATIKEIVNVVLAQGNIGKPGAGLCPVRGHSNVQGDRTMGIWEKLPEHFGDALREEFGFEPPRERGLDVVDSVRALRDGEAHVFVGLGGNFAAATPDPEVTHAALRNADLTVAISTKLNRSHVVCGRTALILPTLGRTEVDLQASGPQSVSVEDSMSAVHLSHGRLAPASPHLRSEVSIVSGMAAAVLEGRPDLDIDWSALAADYGRIREHISHVVPGCASYAEKLERPGGFVLPHPPRDSRTFETESGRAEFSVSPMGVLDVPEGHLLLQTLRSHDQFNTTVYGFDDRYRGLSGSRRVVLVHPDDIHSLGFTEGDIVDVVNETDDGSVRVMNACRVVSYPTPRGCAAAYYPEANVLVPLDSTARGSNCPTYKSILVRLAPMDPHRATALRHKGQGTGSDDGHKSGVQPHHLS
jgi:molybdopterin-dependent oxidoreductase alpha subunit